MAEYIDRKALGIGKCNPEIFDDKGYANGWNAAIEIIQSAPAADVRPVVMCLDCDYWNDWDSAGKESLGNYVCSCAYWSVEDGAVFYTRPTDFCSYGEKREES